MRYVRSRFSTYPLEYPIKLRNPWGYHWSQFGKNECSEQSRAISWILKWFDLQFHIIQVGDAHAKICIFFSLTANYTSDRVYDFWVFNLTTSAVNGSKGKRWHVKLSLRRCCLVAFMHWVICEHITNVDCQKSAFDETTNFGLWQCA